MTKFRLLILACFAAPPAHAEISLSFPVACTLGETCFLQQFMDRDPGPGARDFACGPQSYDGHSGTDIRVPDLEAMEAGVTVLAAAPGVVRGMRDGVPDTGTAGMPEGQNCGNGVAITHADGWETQYCHLRLGSVAVQTGDMVEAGTPLGEIGFSGATEFPHLHLTVRQNGTAIDPFDPSETAQCGVGATPLWADPLPLVPGAILSIGFADGVPEFDTIKAGEADAARLDATGPALVLWGFAHSVREGDRLRLEISRGAETVFEQDITLDRTQAQMFRAGGRRTPAGGWAPGLYQGTVTLMRGGEVLSTRSTEIPVD